MKRLTSKLLWNLRFRLGWRILPGNHKHVSVTDTETDTCPRCTNVIYPREEDQA